MSTETGAVESYVEVAPDSTGKKIRNLLVTVPASDGTSNPVYQQVVGLADVDGFPIAGMGNTLDEILAELRSMRLLLALGFSGMGIDGVDIDGSDTERED